MAAAALPDGSFAIAQQHDEECFYDTITNILMFADVYKDAFEPIIKECENLTQEDQEIYLKGVLYGSKVIDEYEQALGAIIMLSIRRFINIRNHGLIRVPHRLTNYERYILGQKGRERKLPSVHRARAASMNRSGENAMAAGEESICIGQRRSFEIFEKINSLGPLDGKVRATRVWEGLSNFIAAHHDLSEQFTSHAVGIIRSDGEYFLVDNELGISIKINRDIIQQYNGKNLSLEIIPVLYMGIYKIRRIYRIGDIIIYETLSDRIQINASTNIRKEPVALTVIEPLLKTQMPYQTYLYEIPGGAAAAPPQFNNTRMEGGKRRKRLRVTRTASKANRRYSLRKRRSRLYRKI